MTNCKKSPHNSLSCLSLSVCMCAHVPLHLPEIQEPMTFSWELSSPFISLHHCHWDELHPYTSPWVFLSLVRHSCVLYSCVCTCVPEPACVYILCTCAHWGMASTSFIQFSEFHIWSYCVLRAGPLLTQSFKTNPPWARTTLG